MTRHLVGTVDEIRPGQRKIMEVAGRSIGIFNIGGEYFALRNRCPHQGAELCTGQLTSAVRSSGPGEYETSRPGEMLRCPWHGWEFDLRTGQSWFDPRKVRVKPYRVGAVSGKELVDSPEAGTGEHPPSAGWQPGPYSAERMPVRVEENYLFVEM